MIDFDELKQGIRALSPRKKLFRVLKEGLSELGYWQNRPRGNPKQGFRAMKEKVEGSLSEGK